MTTHGEMFHRGAGRGRSYWGPGDLYTFLVTGDESAGAYFVMEALVPPGGGPPMHIHRKENETFYVLNGQCTFHLGDETILAGPGDFVNIPIGQLHCFHNASDAPVRLILSFAPAGIEKFFEETLEIAEDPSQPPPDNIAEVSARYVEAAPRYGLEFFVDQ
jgi:quercetin dioxygenase-like cupin family protein